MPKKFVLGARFQGFRFLRKRPEKWWEIWLTECQQWTKACVNTWIPNLDRNKVTISIPLSMLHSYIAYYRASFHRLCRKTLFCSKIEAIFLFSRTISSVIQLNSSAPRGRDLILFPQKLEKFIYLVAHVFSRSIKINCHYFIFRGRKASFDNCLVFANYSLEFRSFLCLLLCNFLFMAQETERTYFMWLRWLMALTYSCSSCYKAALK